MGEKFLEMGYRFGVNQKKYICIDCVAAEGLDDKMKVEKLDNISTKSDSKNKKKKIVIDENLINKRFRVELVKAQLTDENFELYYRYCQEVHGKMNESKEGFQRFLCMTNLEFRSPKSRPADKDEPDSTKTKPGHPENLEYGCYHMNWYLDNKLMAVGVLDILPECMSSVYFFFDPKYKPLQPGIIGSIYEIEWMQKLQKTYEEFRWYYLGYYIQNCKKMIYKGDYGPAQLLCPSSYTWVDLNEEVFY